MDLSFLQSKLESQRRDYESQIASLKKTHSTELQSQLKKCEREKREMEDNLREAIERKVTIVSFVSTNLFTQHIHLFSTLHYCR